MLLTKTVIMKWRKNNKDWYENKGYVFTKNGDKFKIKTEDLTNGSNIKVEAKCDNLICTTPITKPIKWQDYIKCVKDDGKYYCNKCANKLYGKENRRIARLKNGDNSFAKYLIDLYGEDALDLYWDYERNINKNGISINPWNVNKKTSKQKVYIKCQKKNYHESSLITPIDFFGGVRCSYCGNFGIHPLDSIGKILEDKKLLYLWSDKNEKSPYEYNPHSTLQAWWKCLDGKHEEYFRSVKVSNKYEFRCPECVSERDESFLQEKVRLYLETLGYTILHENKCTIIPLNPKTNRKLPFDNEIKELKFICEVHGRQHYEDTTGYFKNSMSLHKRKLYDRYKKLIAHIQGYEYIVIPYWTDNKQEEWKVLLNNKLIKI